MELNNHEVIREYRILRTDVLYPFDYKKENDFPSEKDNIKEKREQLFVLSKELFNIKPEVLEQCRNNLLQSIQKAIELTSLNVEGFRISRNQGLIVPNYIYGKVLRIMESAMNSVTGYVYSEIYFEDNGDFNSSNLVNFLNEFYNQLEVKELESFYDLELFYDANMEKLKVIWTRENVEYPQERY